METLCQWRVQEKDRRGRLRWRLVRSPMTEETARFWAANNNKVVERIDVPVAPRRKSSPVAGAARPATKTR